MVKRDTFTILSIGCTTALACILFPTWTWRQEQPEPPKPMPSLAASNPHVHEFASWCGFRASPTKHSKRAFVFSPSVPDAQKDIDTDRDYFILIFFLTAISLIVFPSKRSEREAGVYWREKWSSTDA